MKSRSPVLVLILCLLTVLSLAPLTGCNTGASARREALVPALVLSSDGFESDVYAGIAAMPLEDQPDSTDIAVQYFEGVRSGDLSRIVSESLPVWPSIRALAISGINAKLGLNQIGPLGAASKLERVENVENALGKTTGIFDR